MKLRNLESYFWRLVDLLQYICSVDDIKRELEELENLEL